MHLQKVRRESVSQPILIIAIAVPSGVLMLAVATILIWLLRKRWREHKRALAVVTEQDLGARPVRKSDMSKAHHSTSMQRRNSFLPYVSSQGWDTLHSHEDLGEPTLVSHAQNQDSSILNPLSRKRDKIRTQSPKHKSASTGQSIPLKKFKVVSRLSAIMESPRSQSTKTPSPALASKGTESPQEVHPAFCRQPKPSVLSNPAINESVPHPGSPAPDAVPSMTKKPKSISAPVEEAKIMEKCPRGSTSGRSISIPTILGPLPDNAILGHTTKSPHLPIHTRSRSFCGQLPSEAPKGPVPPLPKVHLMEKGRGRSKSTTERIPSWNSNSSVDSGGSSILGTPLAWRSRYRSKDHLGENSSAQVKEGANRELSNSIVRPRAQRQSSLMGEQWQSGRGPIRSNAAELDFNSRSSNPLSRACSSSSLSSTNSRLYVGQVKTVDRMSINRISSGYSTYSFDSRSTSRISVVRHSRSRVTLDGSPEEKRENSTLRDISGNSLTLSRHVSDVSDMSLGSGEDPLQCEVSGSSSKPSALKGSPSARKGHRRCNNVRISSLAPTVFGQDSGPLSPSGMSGIQEETAKSAIFPEKDILPGLGFPGSRALPELPTASPLDVNRHLQPQPLRTSLTPSSPTLSWTSYRQGGADGYFGGGDRDSKTMTSELSSDPSIPSFPSPVRDTNRTSPMRSKSPTGISHTSTLMANIMGSSPHFTIEPDQTTTESLLAQSYQFAAVEPYDPTRPALDFPPNQHTTSFLYDPASPALGFPTSDFGSSSPGTGQMSRSSPTLKDQGSLQNSSSMITHASDLSLSPPVSPIPRPASGTINFSNPFKSTPPQLHPPSIETQLRSLQPQRAAPNPQQSDQQNRDQHPAIVPPVLGATAGGLFGPRTQPPSPIRKSVEALRRMNSEAAQFDEGGEKRWRRLAREASPVLPDLPDLEADDIADLSYALRPLSISETWTGDLTMEDIPIHTPPRPDIPDEDGDDDDSDDEEIDMRALEEEIVSSLEEADALERADAEGRERLGLELAGGGPDALSPHNFTTTTSSYGARQPLGVIGQGRSPVMSSVPEEAAAAAVHEHHGTQNAHEYYHVDADAEAKFLRGAGAGAGTAGAAPAGATLPTSKSKSEREVQRESGSSTTMTTTMMMTPNIWEDGERFWEMTVNQARRSLALEMERREQERESRLESERWEERGRRGFDGMGTVGVDMRVATPTKGGHGGDAEGLGSTLGSENGNWNGVSSIQGTPRSLYDREGFLRT